MVEPVEMEDRGEAGDRRWAGLMAAAQAGDQRAYEQVLRELVPFIRAVVGPRHRNTDRVDDIVQDTLATIHRVRHTYDPGRSLKHWVAAIAHRRSIDALRRRMRTDSVETVDDAAYETFADPAANREMAARDAASELGGAIASLPKGQREALELVKLREMSLVEASAVSGQSVGALKVNVHRAIKALRILMRGE